MFKLTVKSLLLKGGNLSDNKVEHLSALLQKLRLLELKTLTKELSICLTRYFGKDDIIDRIMGMVCIRALQNPMLTQSTEATGISYFIKGVKHILHDLPPFNNVTQ